MHPFHINRTLSLLYCTPVLERRKLKCKGAHKLRCLDRRLSEWLKEPYTEHWIDWDYRDYRCLLHKADPLLRCPYKMDPYTCSHTSLLGNKYHHPDKPRPHSADKLGIIVLFDHIPSLRQHKNSAYTARYIAPE